MSAGIRTGTHMAARTEMRREMRREMRPEMPSEMRSGPVFVYGALRSGTTMFRLMLNAHAQVQNPGEVDFLFDYLRRDPSGPGGWRYDRAGLSDNRIFRAHGLDLPEGVDGLDLLADFIRQFRARDPQAVLTMNVHREAGRIAEALPAARLVHLLRDPRDVARSSVVMGWAGLSYYGVDHWIATERSWDAAGFPATRVLTLKFEDLMADLGGELGRVCAFLGVPFSAAMLDYHRDTTYGPPDPKLAEQWRRQAARREVALIEDKCGDLIAARGYAKGPVPHHPGRLELASLALRNNLGRRRASLRRFGLPLLVGAKLSGWVGATGLHRHFRRRMDARTAENLK